MCVIIAMPPGKMPDDTDWWDAMCQNDDGHGWTIRTPRGLIHDKGMKSVDVENSFRDARKRWPHQWAVWHSRFATQGVEDETNCQPFVIKDGEWAMAHNGVLHLDDGPFDNRDRSDSRIFAEDHLAYATWAQLLEQKQVVDDWLRPSKVVVLSGKRERHGPIIIFGEQRGTWSSTDGCWWSSRPYHRILTPTTQWATQGSIFADDEEDDDEYIEWWKANGYDRTGNRIHEMTDTQVKELLP